MTQHSLPTRLAYSSNTMLAETPGQQRKAFRDLVVALLAVRTCGQATLARHFANFEAASRRLTRWLHTPRVAPPAHARAHAQAVVRHLPRTGTVRLALDWTTADQPHLRIAAGVVGRRAGPLYWEASPTAALKGGQRAREHAFVDQLLGVGLGGLARERVVVRAERGCCTGDFLAVRDRWGVGFVVRRTAHVPVWLDQQWQQLGSLALRGTTRPRLLGRLGGRRSKPPR